MKKTSFFCATVFLAVLLAIPFFTNARTLGDRINEAFRSVFSRNPSVAENTYWLQRVANNDWSTFEGLRNTMMYQRSRGWTAGAPAGSPAVAGAQQDLGSRVNEAFRSVFRRNPNQAENNYWLRRVNHFRNITSFQGLVDAMRYHQLQGRTIGDEPPLPQATNDREDLIRVVLPLFAYLYGDDPSELEKGWWRQRISCEEITTYDGLVVSMAYHRINGARMGRATICGNTEGIFQGNVQGLDNHPLGPLIRVGITSAAANNGIRVTANSDFQVRAGKSRVLRTLRSGEVVHVRWVDGRYSIKGPGIDTTTTDVVRLVPLNGGIVELVDYIYSHRNSVPGPQKRYNRYRGIMELRRCTPHTSSSGRVFQCNLGAHGNNSLWAINELRVEHYLRGLGETSGTGPVEYLKALGTAARTYALYHLIVTGGRYPAEGFDITNTPNDQIYAGYEFEENKSRMMSIFDATKGIVITDTSGMLRVPVYFSDSPGHTLPFPDPHPRFSHLHHSVKDPHGTGRACGPGGNHCYGMSAQGAFGFANVDGWSFQRILTYYYKGVQLVRGY